MHLRYLIMSENSRALCFSWYVFFFAGNPGCVIFSSDFSPCQKLKVK